MQWCAAGCFCAIERPEAGGPLSPYLFLFVADGLATLLNREVEKGTISPLKIAQGSPGISNLLFADDSLLFVKATVDQARKVKELLDLFQKCSGQLLSHSKCSTRPMESTRRRPKNYAFHKPIQTEMGQPINASR